MDTEESPYHLSETRHQIVPNLNYFLKGFLPTSLIQQIPTFHYVTVQNWNHAYSADNNSKTESHFTESQSERGLKRLVPVRSRRHTFSTRASSLPIVKRISQSPLLTFVTGFWLIPLEHASQSPWQTSVTGSWLAMLDSISYPDSPLPKPFEREER